MLSLNLKQGFTLAELLISLAILGVIATFTIPKVISSQQNSEYTAIVKESATIMSQAYQQYKLENNDNVPYTVGIKDLTQYINYVSVDVTRAVDDVHTGGSYNCSASNPCLMLHNGAALHYSAVNRFGDTQSTNAIYFHVDPDGVYGGTTNGPGKAVPIFIYYNGRITDQGNLVAGTMSGGSSFNPNPPIVPPWFNWK